MIKVLWRTKNDIDQTAVAIAPDGSTIKVHWTYAWAPAVTMYDRTNRRWLCGNEWTWDMSRPQPQEKCL